MYRICRCALVLSLSLAASARSEPLPTNMDLIVATLEQAVDEALADLDVQQEEIDWDLPLLVKSETKNEANWLVNHVLSERLLQRGFQVTLDSTLARGVGARLSYRILSLSLSGHSGLLGGKVRRQSEIGLSLRLSHATKDKLYWRREVRVQRQDSVPKKQIELLQNSSYKFAKTDLKTQSLGKFIEPIVVSSVLGGLAFLFFSNR